MSSPHQASAAAPSPAVSPAASPAAADPPALSPASPASPASLAPSAGPLASPAPLTPPGPPDVPHDAAVPSALPAGDAPSGAPGVVGLPAPGTPADWNAPEAAGEQYDASDFVTATELAQPDDDSLTELDARTHVLLYQKFADDKWVVEHCVSGEVVELEEGPTELALQYSHDKAQYFVIGTGGGVPKPVRRWLRKFVLLR